VRLSAELSLSDRLGRPSARAANFFGGPSSQDWVSLLVSSTEERSKFEPMRDMKPSSFLGVSVYRFNGW
jgi:hypothetical protein